MGRSRVAWAGSAVAPWGIALGLLVSITAQADQDPDLSGAVAVNLSFPSAAGAALISASYTTGSASELSAVADEIDPKAALKAGRVAAMPAINRAHKGDPIVPLRPGIDARARGAMRAIAATAESAEDWPDDSRSPAAPALAPTPPALATARPRQFPSRPR